MTITPSGPPAGWYDDGSRPGMQRWWDGTQYTDHYQPAAVAAPAAPAHTTGPMTANDLNVNRQVIYNRQQTGHSLTLHILLVFVFIGMITIPYYSLSPNHYWHA